MGGLQGDKMFHIRNFKKLSEVLGDRMIKYIKKITILILGLFLTLIIRVLKIFNIFFIEYPNAFGHQALNLEYYGRKIQSSGIKKPRIIVFKDKKTLFANYALYLHHKHSGIRFVQNSLIVKLLVIGMTFQKEMRKKGYMVDAFMQTDMASLQTDKQVHTKSNIFLPFNSHLLSRFGQVLDSMSLNRFEYFLFQDRNLGYHSNRNTANNFYHMGRVEDAKDFSLASIQMDKVGVKTVRFGSESPPILFDSCIIDYPNIYRDRYGDVADIALMHGCKFFAGPNSGLMFFAHSLNKPVLFCNAYPWPWMHIPMRKNSVSMPKKLWLIDEKRMMTISEMIQMESAFYYKKLLYEESFFDSLRIEVVNNTAEEINASVLEINQRIDGEWSGHDYLLSDLLSGHIGHDSCSVLSTAFAEMNPDILGKYYIG